MKNIEYRYPYSREHIIENCKTVYREHQDKYLIKFNGDDEILFGVERAAHSINVKLRMDKSVQLRFLSLIQF